MCQVADQLAERLFPTVEKNEPPLANGIAPIAVAGAPDRAQGGSVPAVQAAEGAAAAAAASGSAVRIATSASPPSKMRGSRAAGSVSATSTNHK